jgi:predicted dehydrogenase
VAALESGHDVLLEKPLAPTAGECLELVATAERTGRELQVCHVLRYTPFFRALNHVVRSGVLGELVTVEHRENIATWHMAHSYVRGAYADTGRSSPTLLAKCCHDLDVLLWNLDRRCRWVGSMGSLLSFTADHAPAGAPRRCTDGCPVQEECPYSAPFIYLGRRGDDPAAWSPVTPFSWMPLTDHGSWDPSTGMLTESPDERLAELRTGPYGRCVYHCENDAVDHQVVSLEFSDGVTATLVMQGHSGDDERTIRYDGTRGTLFGRFGDFTGSSLTVRDHRSGEVSDVPLERVRGLHGGGDVGIMRAFAATLRGEQEGGSGAKGALSSHLVGFAAERARRTNTVVDFEHYRAGLADPMAT